MNHYVQRYARSTAKKMAADEREAIAREHTVIVKQIAGRIVSRLPGHYDLEDLYSAGVLGLLTAIDNFDESRGIPFDRYARIRIEGAILDALRESDHLPRTRRQKSKRLEATRRDLERDLGRPPSDHEVADAAGETMESVQSSLLEAVGPTFLAPADLARVSPTAGPEADPLAQICTAEVHAALARAIEELPDRLKLLMSLYYREELNYKEIGRILGVSESRICHLHTEAVNRLRDALRAY
jgi:RNA polymerase sigma factor for flagellar operon FliA